jgi:hypothetical protein
MNYCGSSSWGGGEIEKPYLAFTTPEQKKKKKFEIKNKMRYSAQRQDQ